MLFFIVLLALFEHDDATHIPIDTLNLFRSNDYDTCLAGTPDRTIDVTDDGNCYELVAETPELELIAFYYETFSDMYTGTHSAASYEVQTLAILTRCGCEHGVARGGNRAYNDSCLVAKVAQGCETFKYREKVGRYWNKLYDDPLLEFWGIDANYIENVLLY